MAASFPLNRMRAQSRAQRVPAFCRRLFARWLMSVVQSGYRPRIAFVVYGVDAGRETESRS
jgi:hypothetical protein